MTLQAFKNYTKGVNQMIRNCNYNNGELYIGFNKWFLKNAKYFNKVDQEKSKELSKYAKIKECYRNCYIVFAENEKKYDYYQGYSWNNDLFFPIEHTFLVDKKTKLVIDPTYALKEVNGFSHGYIGIKIPKLQLSRLMLQSGHFRNFLMDIYKMKVKIIE